MQKTSPRKQIFRIGRPEQFLAELLTLDRAQLEQLVVNKVWECDEYRALRDEMREDKSTSERQMRKVKAINELLCEQWNQRLARTTVEAEAIFFEKYSKEMAAMKESNAKLEAQNAKYGDDHYALVTSQAAAVAKAEQCTAQLGTITRERSELQIELDKVNKAQCQLRLELTRAQMTNNAREKEISCLRTEKAELLDGLNEAMRRLNRNFQEFIAAQDPRKLAKIVQVAVAEVVAPMQKEHGALLVEMSTIKGELSNARQGRKLTRRSTVNASDLTFG
eukprot:GEMP01065264.1.p1 GENE.GEMP01065264.1~~GEMP01065264.1.p1  ORF type:complete len:278 (+),score=86.18 GEMP01065264.1:41-874(+)